MTTTKVTLVTYSSSAGAVITLTRTLAQEIGPHGRLSTDRKSA
jgi:NAD(P)-dependent dehydrogenase (short-subunit alcohol dehydrogenase family)